MDDFDEGFSGTDVVYAKSWGAMVTTTDEAEEDKRLINKYDSWMTDERHMALTNDDAIFMHPLPADRNVEVTDAVIDGPQVDRLRPSREPPARPEGRDGADDELTAIR